MKAGIVGMGAVGRAAALAATQRRSASELILVNRHDEVSRAVALDLGYGTLISAPCRVSAGTHLDLAGAGIVVVAAGVNEKGGGATDRNDPQGRLRLLRQNAAIVRDIVPQLIEAAPEAVILMATDPPDLLADVVRIAAPQAKTVSTGTWLDSLRFRTHLAEAFGINPRSVQADVLGEHGVSEVLHWSGATVAGAPWKHVAGRRGFDERQLRKRVEDKVRFANINIIEGIGASQYGIGIVIARIIEAVLNDERIAVPIGSYHPQHEVTYSVPTVLGAGGSDHVIEPMLEPEEQSALDRSIATLREALTHVAPTTGSQA
jgi:L-lactate dehydrogenase